MLDDDKKKPSEQSLEVWRKTFETNLFGLIATTQALLPLLRKSAAGRIVNLSSILGSIHFHATPGSPVYDSKLPAYDVSKSAVNAHTVHLAAGVKGRTLIKVNAAHPGWVKTDEMGGEGATMDISDGAKTSVALATLSPDGPSSVTCTWAKRYHGNPRHDCTGSRGRTAEHGVMGSQRESAR